jgi:hypothetical protein
MRTIESPIKVEVRAKASSNYTRELIETRLAVLRLRDDDEARLEIEYLESLKARTTE